MPSKKEIAEKTGKKDKQGGRKVSFDRNRNFAIFAKA